jgi:hypothetical protein
MLIWFGRMTPQKAWLLMTVCMTASAAEPIPFNEMSKSMRRAFEQRGGTAMRVTLPAKGNPMSRKIKEHVQPVDSLAKMSRRYTSEKDMAYRRSLAALIYLAAFAGGDQKQRRGMIDALVMQLGADDPQITEIASRIK